MNPIHGSSSQGNSVYRNAMEALADGRVAPQEAPEAPVGTNDAAPAGQRPRRNPQSLNNISHRLGAGVGAALAILGHDLHAPRAEQTPSSSSSPLALVHQALDSFHIPLDGQSPQTTLANLNRSGLSPETMLIALQLASTPEHPAVALYQITPSQSQAIVQELGLLATQRRAPFLTQAAATRANDNPVQLVLNLLEAQRED